MIDAGPTESLPVIDLRALGNDPAMPGLTPAAAQFLAESAAVCLEDQGHASSVQIAVRGEFDTEFNLLWTEVTEQMRRTFSDMQEATEYGACGIAVLMVPAVTGLTVIERSRRGTGFDYWLGIPDALPFQNKARLEVSGILRGTRPQIASRIRQKLEQTRVSDNSGLPVYVVVVEYSSPIAEVVRR